MSAWQLHQQALLGMQAQFLERMRVHHLQMQQSQQQQVCSGFLLSEEATDACTVRYYAMLDFLLGLSNAYGMPAFMGRSAWAHARNTSKNSNLA